MISALGPGLKMGMVDLRASLVSKRVWYSSGYNINSHSKSPVPLYRSPNLLDENVLRIILWTIIWNLDPLPIRTFS